LQKPFMILFYEDEKPMDYRCIQRFIRAFPKSYQNVVERTIRKSERLDKATFGSNLAELMPSFQMTRAGAFYGLGITEKGTPIDPNNVINLCWNEVGEELQELKDYIKKNASCPRSRVMTDLSPKSRENVVKVTAQLFEKLKTLYVRSSQVGRVGATKVLFAALPEIAVPVDNLEWRQVFKTDSYGEILTTMTSEIIEWEKIVHKRLETLSPLATTTLPSIYNILAMAARDLTKANW